MGCKRRILQGFALQVATLVLMVLAWADYWAIMNSLSAFMLTFEQEPAQGWDYWRWYFIKQHLAGILPGVAIILTLFGFVLYGWFRYLRCLLKDSKK